MHKINKIILTTICSFTILILQKKIYRVLRYAEYNYYNIKHHYYAIKYNVINNKAVILKSKEKIIIIKYKVVIRDHLLSSYSIVLLILYLN